MITLEIKSSLEGIKLKGVVDANNLSSCSRFAQDGCIDVRKYCHAADVIYTVQKIQILLKVLFF